MDDLSQRRLDRALAAMADRDPEAAADAEAAFGALTAGEGLDVFGQRDLQTFLWYSLNREWPLDTEGRLRLADALGALFGRLGRDRYAAICRSETTRTIIAAWTTDEDDAWRRYERAQQASGVEPPDLPEFSWGPVMGLEEARARDEVAWALEEAIVSGELRPGGRGWRGVQQRIVREWLGGAHPGGDGRPRASVVLEERIGTWRASRSDERADLLAGVELDASRPPEPPDSVAPVIGPVRYLLERADGEGIPLTATHRLKPGLVTDMSRRFDWWAPGTRRLEDDVSEVWRTRGLAESVGALRRRRDRLVLTPRGRDLVTDDVALWRTIAAALVVGDGFDEACAELAVAVLATTPVIAGDEVRARIHGALRAEGWHDAASGDPVPVDAVRRALLHHGHTWRVLGLVEERGDWMHPELRVTDEGAATFRRALWTAATAPRTRIG